MLKFTLKVPKVAADDWWKKSKKELNALVETTNREEWPKERDIETQQRWAPRKQPTGSWKILRKTGRMQDSATFKPGIRPLSFTVKTTEYGVFHQNGTSRMPQRRWIGFPEDIGDKMGDIIAKNIFYGSMRFSS